MLRTRLDFFARSAKIRLEIEQSIPQELLGWNVDLYEIVKWVEEGTRNEFFVLREGLQCWAQGRC